MAAMQPTQKQLALPLLEAIEERGGSAPMRDLYDAVAAKVDLDPTLRDVRVSAGSKTYNRFERDVRWAQMQAKAQGLLAKADERHWRLTGTGEKALRHAKPGIVITVFTTSRGVALFGSCEDAIGLLDDGAVQLILSSPPYPLIRQKTYGNLDETAHVDWLLRLAEGWARKLSPNGSLVLNMGDTWVPGQPSMSLYQERLLVRLQDSLGFNLSMRYAWQNPSRLPVPAQWVTVKRVRVKPSLENVFWLSQSANPYADNRNVLAPYSDSMRKVLARGGQAAASRPAGYEMKQGAFGQNNGGAIPGNLIVAANTESNSAYIRACKAEGLPVHPARFPKAIPEHFIKLLTRPQDLVYDPFGGSSTTGAVAEELDRRWVTSDCVLDYVLGARHRFPDARMAAG